MQITFLMGNGFDIGLGLHTGYESFYKEYIKAQSTDNKNITLFKEMLKNRNTDEEKRIIDWADFEKAFGQHSTAFTIEEKRQYIERFEDFVTNFNTYLEAEEKQLDFSNKSLIQSTMKTAVSTYFHIRAADRDAVQNIYDSDGSRRIYNFISFNYTKSVDECASIFKNNLSGDSLRTVGKVLHIHGFVEENMIMGVNDASQIINEDFAKDEDIIREIVKPQQNSDTRSNYEKHVIDLINNSNIICVYGMSIGDTDKKWWIKIGEWLSKNNKRALVILKYDKKYNKRFPFNQNQFIDSVINKFLKLSEQPESIQNQIRSRIFVGMNHNVFSMDLCKKTKKDSDLINIDSVEESMSYVNKYSEAVQKAITTVEQTTKIANK